jgi:hypothetical protein
MPGIQKAIGCLHSTALHLAEFSSSAERDRTGCKTYRHTPRRRGIQAQTANAENFGKVTRTREQK